MKIFKVFLVTLIFSIGISAATFTVNDASDVQDLLPGDGNCKTTGNVCTLRAAITEANALAGADIIDLPAGTYTETLVSANEDANVGGDFDITSDITINGAATSSVFVEANSVPGIATERVFHIRAATTATALTVNINNLTVRNGRYNSNTFGAGIRIDQGTSHNITLSDLLVMDNLNQSSGGGIAVSDTISANINIVNCKVTNNNAGGAIVGTTASGGGIFLNSATSSVNIINSIISSNTATGPASFPTGAGLYSIGTTSVTDSTISSNTATSPASSSFGGGAGILGGTTTFLRSRVIGNTVTITGSPGSGHTASSGGIHNQGATVNILNSTVSNNSVSNPPTPPNASFAGVTTIIVGGTPNSTTNITDSTISNNTAYTQGGGVTNWSSDFATATTNIIRSTINGNSTTGAGSAGAGILNSSFNDGISFVNLTNSTISGNTSNGNGGGIFNVGVPSTTATINVNFSTVASNSATSSGGGLCNFATTSIINLKNSIVADNTASSLGPDIFGTITSQDYNHVENTSGGTFFARLGKIQSLFLSLPNDVTGSDPQLGALANNGGATLTQLPASTSPVLNTIPNGTNDCGTVVTTSQNAVTRPQSTGCEKGAAEIAPTAAGSMLKGRLIVAHGRGLANAQIILTNTNTGEIRYARSSAFGYFTFVDLPSGNFYLLDVSSKKYRFNQTSFTLNGDLTDLVLTAQ